MLHKTSVSSDQAAYIINIPSGGLQSATRESTEEGTHVVASESGGSQVRLHVGQEVGGVRTRGTDRAFERHD